MASDLYRSPLRALELFRSGLDTMDIKNVLGVTEAEAYRMVSEQRERERNPRIGFAGQDKTEKQFRRWQ
jgi:hypothetical protein